MIGFTAFASLRSLIKFCNSPGDVVLLLVYYLGKERKFHELCFRHSYHNASYPTGQKVNVGSFQLPGISLPSIYSATREITTG